MADPNVLLLLVLFNLGFAVIRLSSAELAWRDGGGRGWIVALALGLFVAIPHVALAWVGLETRNTLLTVFTSEPEIEAPPATTTTTTTTTVPIVLSPITTLPGQLAEDVIDASKAPPWRPFGEERLNVMLLGGDAGPGRGGLRTDTIMVASVDPLTGGRSPPWFATQLRRTPIHQR